jgi:hypothetical protein
LNDQAGAGWRPQPDPGHPHPRTGRQGSARRRQAYRRYSSRAHPARRTYQGR